MSHYQTALQNYCLKVTNKSLINVAKLKYLGTAVTSQKYYHEETKSRLNMGSGNYHTVQIILSSLLLPRSMKVTVYKTVILQSVEQKSKCLKFCQSESGSDVSIIIILIIENLHVFV
jgi:hypothetical protein